MKITDQIEIEENRFGVEPEVTAKIARLGLVVYEVGIGYDGRTYDEGRRSAGATASGRCS